MFPMELVFLAIETELLFVFVTATSGLPSVSRSPTTSPPGYEATGTLVAEVNDVASMVRLLGKVTTNGFEEQPVK